MRRRIHTTFAIVIAALAILVHTRGEACGLRTAISLWTKDGGHHVPLRGAVFAFDYSRGRPAKVAWEAASGELTLTRISPTVTRIDYQGVEGDVLRVDHHRYILSARREVRVPRARTMRVARACGGTWIDIALDEPIAAARVRWTHQGKVSEFWDDETTYMLGIGVPLETLPLEDLQDGGKLEILVFLDDGSEHVLVSQWIKSPLPRVLGPFGDHGELTVSVSPTALPRSEGDLSSLVDLLLALSTLVLARHISRRAATAD